MKYKLFHGGAKVDVGAKTSKDLHIIQRVDKVAERCVLARPVL